MTTLHNQNFVFSVSIKILYLFIFLSCFFYIIVQKQVKEHLSDNISGMLSENYKTQIDKNNYNIDEYNLLFNYYSKSSLNDNTELEKKTIKYNNLVFFLNVTFIGFFIVIPIIIYYVSYYVFNKKIPIVQILIFNLILYTLVGIIEYIFFITVASKYVPVTNGDILNVIKSYFLK